MKRSFAKCVLMIFAVVVAGSFALSANAGDTEDEARLVSGIQKISPSIVAVRPARVVENGRPKFRVVWTPALTIKKDISVKEQEQIASAVAGFVVNFQKGVPTEDVFGGILAFFEGEGWTPYIGQVFYKVENGEVLVMTAKNIVNEDKSVSCCDDDKLIGKITGAKFVTTLR